MERPVQEGLLLIRKEVPVTQLTVLQRTSGAKQETGGVFVASCDGVMHVTLGTVTGTEGKGSLDHLLGFGTVEGTFSGRAIPIVDQLGVLMRQAALRGVSFQELAAPLVEAGLVLDQIP